MSEKARVIKVIQTVDTIGCGCDGNPKRTVYRYFTLKGKPLAEDDPFKTDMANRGLEDLVNSIATREAEKELDQMAASQIKARKTMEANAEWRKCQDELKKELAAECEKSARLEAELGSANELLAVLKLENDANPKSKIKIKLSGDEKAVIKKLESDGRKKRSNPSNSELSKKALEQGKKKS